MILITVLIFRISEKKNPIYWVKSKKLPYPIYFFRDLNVEPQQNFSLEKLRCKNLYRVFCDVRSKIKFGEKNFPPITLDYKLVYKKTKIRVKGSLSRTNLKQNYEATTKPISFAKIL